MQKTLYFGRNDKNIPWYKGLKLHPDGSTDFSITGVYKIEIEDGKDINWGDLFDSQLDILNSFSTPAERRKVGISDSFGSPRLQIYETYIVRFWTKLEQNCHEKSKAEQGFFDLYCKMCWVAFDYGCDFPALIPNIFVNDSREKDANNECPSIVDFVFKSSKFGTDNLVVVEIDGPSHYGTYNSDGTYTLSEKEYVKHLKKDRWLRKQGFKVFRIGNSEIEKITDLPKEARPEAFVLFFEEIFGFAIHPESAEPEYTNEEVDMIMRRGI